MFFGLSYVCFASDFCFQGSKFGYVGCFCFFSDLCIQGSNLVCVGVVFSSVICVPKVAIYFVRVCGGCHVFFDDLCFQDSNFVRVDVLFSSVICVSKVVILCMCRYCVCFSNLCSQGVSSNFVHAWVLCFVH